MNGRGGRRQGAGRPSLLSDWDQIVLGSKCEQVLNRIANARVQQQLRDDLAETDLPEQWRWVNSKPLHERKAWRATDEAKEHSESVQDERRALKLTPINGRYGVRRRVLSEVSKWAAAHFGVELKRSFIEDSWERYRALLKEL